MDLASPIYCKYLINSIHRPLNLLNEKGSKFKVEDWGQHSKNLNLKLNLAWGETESLFKWYKLN